METLKNRIKAVEIIARETRLGKMDWQDSRIDGNYTCFHNGLNLRFVTKPHKKDQLLIAPKRGMGGDEVFVDASDIRLDTILSAILIYVKKANAMSDASMNVVSAEILEWT